MASPRASRARSRAAAGSGLAQRRASPDPARAARQARPAGFLDLRLNQLHPRTAAVAGAGGPLRRRARRHRRARRQVPRGARRRPTSPRRRSAWAWSTSVGERPPVPHLAGVRRGRLAHGGAGRPGGRRGGRGARRVPRRATWRRPWTGHRRVRPRRRPGRRAAATRPGAAGAAAGAARAARLSQPRCWPHRAAACSWPTPGTTASWSCDVGAGRRHARTWCASSARGARGAADGQRRRRRFDHPEGMAFTPGRLSATGPGLHGRRRDAVRGRRRQPPGARRRPAVGRR